MCTRSSVRSVTCGCYLLQHYEELITILLSMKAIRKRREGGGKKGRREEEE